MFQSFLETKHVHLFADAAEIFHELGMFETFKHLLQLHYEEMKLPSLFALELVLIAIELQDTELFALYIPSIKKELYWFIAANEKLPDAWKSKLKGLKTRLQIAATINVDIHIELRCSYVNSYNAATIKQIHTE